MSEKNEPKYETLTLGQALDAVAKGEQVVTHATVPDAWENGEFDHDEFVRLLRERDEYEKNNAARLREHRRYEIARDCMSAFACAPPDDVAILEDMKGAAECAVKWADALLAELEKKQ